MKKLKSLLAAVVATVALCTLLPAVAFAAGEPDDTSYEALGTCGSNISWMLQADGTLELSGAGAMGAWNYNGTYYDDGTTFPYASAVTSVTISEGITNVGHFAGFANLTEVSLPSTLTSMDEGIFNDCPSLLGLDLPDGITSAPFNGFINAGCTSFKTLKYSCKMGSFASQAVGKDKMKEVEYIARHNPVSVGMQPVTIDKDGTSEYGHEAGLQCSNCNKFFTDETCTTDCTAEKTIARLGVVRFGDDFGGTKSAQVYFTGEEIVPTFVIHDSATNDIDPQYYDIQFSDKLVNVGTYDVTISFHGKYVGEMHLQLSIVGNLAETTVEFLDSVQLQADSNGDLHPVITYCGCRPTADMLIKCVRDKAGNVIPRDQWTMTASGQQATTENNRYIVYIKPTDGSNYVGQNNSVRLSITQLDILDSSMVSFPTFDTPILYDPEVDGEAFPTPDVEGTILSSGVKLADGKHVNVKYRINDEGTMGYADISVRDTIDLKPYGGQVAKTIEYPLVKRMDVADTNIFVSDCAFTGKAQTPKVSIPVPGHLGMYYQEGVDYTVEYRDNVAAGIGTAVVTAIENEDGTSLLTGSTEVKFAITQMKLSACTISVSKLAYTGKAQTPKVTVTTPSGVKLTTADYTVSKTKSATVGKTTFKITGKGSLVGSKTLYVTILPKSTSITKLVRGKQCFKVYWSKRTAQTSGYQIRYSLKKDMSASKTKTIAGTKTTAAKISKLKAKKRYYVQVRTYKTVGKTKYYSAWSKVKYVTTQ